MIPFAPDPPPAGVDPATAEWVLRQLVLLSQSTAATAEQVQDGTATTDQLQQEVDAVEQDLAAHVQNVTDAHAIDDKLEWHGVWAAGAYVRNDMVRDQGWLMVANIDTSDAPAPAGLGEEYQLAPEPTWGPPVAVPAVFGMRWSRGFGRLYGVRVKIPNAGPADVYLMINGVRRDIATAEALAANTWREWLFEPILLGGPTDLVVSAGSYLFSTNYFLDPDVRGFYGTTYPPSSVTDEAYGADMLIDHLIESPDWDVMVWPN